jgi:hypothetical protein
MTAKHIEHRGQRIVQEGPRWTLEAGGPKQVMSHPLGSYLGLDDRDALSREQTDVELGVGAYDKGRRIWPGTPTQFFDSYEDGRIVTEDAFHQALTWLVTEPS